MPGNPRRHIAEALHLFEGRVPARMEFEARDLFPGVVSPFPGRIVSVIGRDDHEVVVADRFQKSAQPEVEFLQRQRISAHIPPVAEEHVEIDEVGKIEPAVPGVPKLLDHLHPVSV